MLTRTVCIPIQLRRTLVWCGGGLPIGMRDTHTRILLRIRFESGSCRSDHGADEANVLRFPEPCKPAADSLQQCFAPLLPGSFRVFWEVRVMP